ncbi:MAG TPA: cupin domain-containing protein [Nitratidesulfovibrio sp.]|nr:cupin domain-containing protein [Nitratidesulfovibrio sp.]
MRTIPTTVLGPIALVVMLCSAVPLAGGCATRQDARSAGHTTNAPAGQNAPSATPQATPQASTSSSPQPASQSASQSVSSVQLVQSERSWDGAMLPAYPQGQPQVTILRITIPAGARLPLHLHPVINAGVLTRGQLTVTTEDGKELHLTAGDPIVEVVNTPHQGFNPGSEPAEIIVFYAGQAGAPLAVKQGQ